MLCVPADGFSAVAAAIVHRLHTAYGLAYIVLGLYVFWQPEASGSFALGVEMPGRDRPETVLVQTTGIIVTTLGIYRWATSSGRSAHSHAQATPCSPRPRPTQLTTAATRPCRCPQQPAQRNRRTAAMAHRVVRLHMAGQSVDGDVYPLRVSCRPPSQGVCLVGFAVPRSLFAIGNPPSLAHPMQARPMQ